VNISANINMPSYSQQAMRLRSEGVWKSSGMNQVSLAKLGPMPERHRNSMVDCGGAVVSG
jgi:hypothetical protein